MSSGRRTSVARRAQYTDSVRPIPTAAGASTYAVTEPTGTSRPAVRKARAKPTLVSVGVSDVMSDQSCQARGAHPFLVLAVLHHRPQGGIGRRLVEVSAAQRGQRLGPVDGLGDAGRLEQFQLPQAGHG